MDSAWSSSTAYDDRPYSTLVVVPSGKPGNIKLLLIYASVKGFGVVLGLTLYGSHQLLVSSHLRERDKMLLRAILSGGVWNGFLLGKVKKEDVPYRFCGAPDNDGHLFGIVPSPPSLSFVTSLSFFLS